MMNVLVAPLDWGLGHATRCIPVIDEFIRRNCKVLIAGSGDSLTLLRREYPSLESFELPAYRPTYSGTDTQIWSMLSQVLRFLSVMRKEHHEVEQIITKANIDIVISDNRYGCWSTKISAIFITHQTNIILPRSLKWMRPFVMWYNAKLINRFSECWIPDYPGSHTLSGKLTQTRNRDPKKMIHIGNLSRFADDPNPVDILYDVLFLLSGPEPQRTILEDLIIRQLHKTELRYLIVRGLVSVAPPLLAGLTYVDYLGGDDLRQVIRKSGVIISRSGYSTIMDLAKLHKKAIFIPTPGQTEQQYLAHRLKKMGIAYSVPQRAFRLKSALERSKKYAGFNFMEGRFSLLQDVVGKLMKDRQ